MKKYMITLPLITILLLISGCHKKANFKAFDTIKNKHWTCAHGATATTVTIDNDLLFIEEETNPNLRSVFRLSEKEKNLFELNLLKKQEIETISKQYPDFEIIGASGEFNYLKVRRNKTIDFANLKDDQLKDFLANDLGHGCELTETIKH